MSNCKNWENNFVGLTTMKINFDAFKLGGLQEKHTVTTWNLETISAFA
jgi:hypothetical protein